MVVPPRERLVPHLVVADATAAIAWYRDVLGLELVACVPHPEDGRVLHAELRGAGWSFYLADDWPQFGTRLPDPSRSGPLMLFVESPRAKELYEQALAGGATALNAWQSTLHGAELGQLRDPHGYEWTFLKPLHAVPADDVERRVDEMVGRRAN